MTLLLMSHSLRDEVFLGVVEAGVAFFDSSTIIVTRFIGMIVRFTPSYHRRSPVRDERIWASYVK